MLPVSVDQPWHVSVASSWSQFSWLDKFWKSQYFLCGIPLFMSEHKPSTKSKERLSTSGEEEKPFPLLWRFQWTQRHLLEVEEVQNQHVSSWSWLTWTERHYNLSRAAEFILGEKRTFRWTTIAAAIRPVRWSDQVVLVEVTGKSTWKTLKPWLAKSHSLKRQRLNSFSPS